MTTNRMLERDRKAINIMNSLVDDIYSGVVHAVKIVETPDTLVIKYKARDAK
jgi:hypothetical protein